VQVCSAHVGLVSHTLFEHVGAPLHATVCCHHAMPNSFGTHSLRGKQTPEAMILDALQGCAMVCQGLLLGVGQVSHL